MVRFEEVPPPLEERVGQSLLARVREDEQRYGLADARIDHVINDLRR